MITRQEMDDLCVKYFYKDGYEFNKNYEHRYDDKSSAQCYSLIRDYKPTSCLSFGTWKGGSAAIIYAALLKNKNDFRYVASEMLPDMREKTIEHLHNKYGSIPAIVGKIEENLHLVPKKLDFVFIDTSHDLENTKWYIKHIFPMVKKGSLVAIHDWAVKEVSGEMVGKGDGGVGGWEETNYIMDLIRKGEFPLEKLYWNYEEGNRMEASFWIKK